MDLLQLNSCGGTNTTNQGMRWLRQHNAWPSLRSRHLAGLVGLWLTAVKRGSCFHAALTIHTSPADRSSRPPSPVPMTSTPQLHQPQLSRSQLSITTTDIYIKQQSQMASCRFVCGCPSNAHCALSIAKRTKQLAADKNYADKKNALAAVGRGI